MKTFIKENIVLTLGITLPLLLVVFFILASTLPQYFVEDPRYDFLFTTRKYNQGDFVTINGKLHFRPSTDKYSPDNSLPELYRYHATTGKVQQIIFEVPELPLTDNTAQQTNMDAEVVVSVDPHNLPSEEQARNTSKIVSEIQGKTNASLPPFAIAAVSDLMLDNNRIAPDGYEFIDNYHHYNYGIGFFGFGRSYHNGTKGYLLKNGKKVEVPYNHSHDGYYSTAYFIGWIVP